MTVLLKDKHSSLKKPSESLKASLIGHDLSLCTSSLSTSIYVYQCTSEKTNLPSGDYTVQLLFSNGGTLTRDIIILNEEPIVEFDMQHTLMKSSDPRVAEETTLSYHLMTKDNQPSYYSPADSDITLSSQQGLEVISQGSVRKGQV